MNEFDQDGTVMAAVDEFFESQVQDIFSEGINKLEKRYCTCIDLEAAFVDCRLTCYRAQIKKTANK
jgi:hypothetical protein